MIFANREHAAYLLLEKLKSHKSENPLVLGIPRGAMPMAKIIATGLGAELGAILVHKICHPRNEELAIGCVGLSGSKHILNRSEFSEISKDYIDNEANNQLQKLVDRNKKYGLKKIECLDRLVIIVDDGIATGATTMCAIQDVRKLRPKKIILAAAVAAEQSLNMLRPMVDEVVVLEVPDNFWGVSQVFEDFAQVDDNEVKRILTGVQQSENKDAHASP